MQVQIFLVERVREVLGGRKEGGGGESIEQGKKY